MKIWVAPLAASLLFTLGFPASAQAGDAPIALSSTVKLEKVVVENGREKIVQLEPKVVVPGDRLQFTTAYRNNTAQRVENFVVTNPLNKAVQLTSESAATLTVSVDGGKSFAALTSLTVTDAEGKTRPAQSGDVTHVRWIVASIAPGGDGDLSFHATVR
jgi:uncharacterized repeat protein (TIGR01451 family)